MRVVSAHDKTVRRALAPYGGREVKHTGDGIMGSFASAAAAVRCAMSIQREVAHLDGAKFQLRIGVASGEPVERQNDIFGSTVQLAARLCARAEPGQILASNVVAELCMGKQLKFETIGDVLLKGFAQPTRAHAVSWS